MTCVLILVAIAVIQALPYSHAAMVAKTSILTQHTIRYDSAPSDDWPTYHRDMFRSGYDPAFPQFTSVSLNWKSTTLDGDVYAEPLIVGTDVIVATEANSVYELSATTGQTLWHINLGTPVNGAVLLCGDINPSGITSTPVIDVAGGTIFVVAFLQSPQLHHELFAIDLGTGNVKFQLPIDPPNATSSTPFFVQYQQQRTALALSNGYVYVGYGGLSGDCGQYHGWLAATNTNGEGPVLTYQVPTGNQGAIWGGGDGPVVDNSGNLLVATGNSMATSTFDYGDAVLKLSPATSPPITLLDYFAPSNWATLNADDLDLGSSEPVILSSNYLFQIGKEGVGYILNANNLGGIGGQLYSSQVCHTINGASGGLAYSSPYLIVPCNNGVAALKVDLGSNPSFTVVWRGPNTLSGPPIIAGNAVWDVDVHDGLIYAFNLTTGQTLFQDTIGSVPTHFNSLSASDGQIFVSANRQVRAYLPQQPSTVMTVSYSVVGGGNPTAPVFHYILNGVSSSFTLTETATAVSVDAGSAWSVTPNPLSKSGSHQQWYATPSSLAGTASATTIVFAFQHQYYLSMMVSGPGTVTPSSGWYNKGAKVSITARASTGHKFRSWSGKGTGSYTGTSKSTTITMNSAITETANFT